MLAPPAPRDEDVRRLDVTVDEAEPVRRVERIGRDLYEDVAAAR